MPNRDFKEFVELLKARRVEYLADREVLVLAPRPAKGGESGAVLPPRSGGGSFGSSA